MIEKALETFTLVPALGERIVGDQLAGALPCYLFVHGLGSMRKGDKSTALFAHAAARGRAAVRYDQRGHGESSGIIGQVAVSELIADASLVLDRIGPSILFGSSLGGLVSAFVAAERPNDVRALVLLAPALGYVQRMKQRLDKHGRLRTSEGFAFPVSQHVLADAELLDELALPKRLPMPVLVVHGTADETVPHSLSEQFFDGIPHAQKDLMIIKGGDHRLNSEISKVLARMDLLLG